MTLKKEDIHRKINHSDFAVQSVTIDALFAITDEWQDLLSRSAVDPLFMGPAWLSSWWDSWGKKRDNVEPIILLVRDASDRLV